MSRLYPAPVLPVHVEPVFYERAHPLGERILRTPRGYPAGIWLYGNTNLLNDDERLISIPATFEAMPGPADLNRIEHMAETLVLAARTLVTGTQTYAMQRAAVVPLRWGAPRILVAHCGLYQYLGEHLREEPFRAARLWRYQFDPETDLAISYSQPWSGKNRQAQAPSPTLINIINSLCKNSRVEEGIGNG